MITVTRILEELFTCNLRWRIPRDIRVFTSWALRWRERIVEKKSERKREQYGVINLRTTDRENFRLIPRDIFQCSKEDSPWRKWGILGKRNFENSTRFSRFAYEKSGDQSKSRIIDLLDVRYFSSLKNNIVTFDSSFYQSIYSMCKL